MYTAVRVKDFEIDTNENIHYTWEPLTTSEIERDMSHWKTGKIYGEDNERPAEN